METLTVEDVLEIHELLARESAAQNDPIFPAGVKSRNLLESAVARQVTSLNGILKYSDPRACAASLTYGLCCNHPFHNGNKRTALVSMLVHLDRNKFLLRDVTHGELYDTIRDLAKHEVAPPKSGRHDADAEVVALQRWITRRAARIERWERPVTGRQLRQILRRFGLELENPSANMMDVVRYEDVPKRWPLRGTNRTRHRLCRIGWHNEGSPVSPSDIRTLRLAAGLREEDGIDARAFYRNEGVVDAFINNYRTVLRKLAKQ